MNAGHRKQTLRAGETEGRGRKRKRFIGCRCGEGQEAVHSEDHQWAVSVLTATQKEPASRLKHSTQRRANATKCEGGDTRVVTRLELCGNETEVRDDDYWASYLSYIKHVLLIYRQASRNKGRREANMKVETGNQEKRKIILALDRTPPTTRHAALPT